MPDASRPNAPRHRHARISRRGKVIAAGATAAIVTEADSAPSATAAQAITATAKHRR